MTRSRRSGPPSRRSPTLCEGGRLIYIGAGTSGRIGLLDAVECPPTFGTSPEQVVGLLSGGPGAFVVAVEGAEDEPARAVTDLDEIGVNDRDTVVGLAASGRTPYVVGGLKHAAAKGAMTVSIACNRDAVISRYADIPIEVPTGPEILTGSTRLKGGTPRRWSATCSRPLRWSAWARSTGTSWSM